MGLFDLFKKKNTELTEDQRKYDKMWKLWEKGRADSPYAELMTYQSEVNNGGHNQYFFNVGNTGDLQKEMTVLETILSPTLQKNLKKAYDAHLTLEDNEDDEQAEEVLAQCDDVFYENEEEINRILKGYADKVKL